MFIAHNLYDAYTDYTAGSFTRLYKPARLALYVALFRYAYRSRS
jgi:hypothetical protein